MTEQLFKLLPPSLRTLLLRLPAAVMASLEEIRVRENRPLEIIHERSAFVSPEGAVLSAPGQAYAVTREDCAILLDLLTNHSVYSHEEELKRGFITIEGGHRVGLAGRTVLEQGRVKLIRDVGSFNIRVAKEIRGSAGMALPLLLDETAETLHHTLVLSPPQQGKTTLVRDLARSVSSGEWSAEGFSGSRKVGIVDERSEIAACVKGVPRFDVGPRTDIMDGCPKAEGMMMMIRSMSPEVLVADEIGKPEDAEAVREALHAGIRVVVTAHASDFRDAESRPALAELIRQRFFGRYLLLRRRPGCAPGISVLDREGRPIRAAVAASTTALRMTPS